MALASDADDPEQPVLDLALELEDAMMLPFVLFADADGEFVGGYSGVVTPPYLIKLLDELIARREKRNAEHAMHGDLRRTKCRKNAHLRGSHASSGVQGEGMGGRVFAATSNVRAELHAPL